MAGSWIDYLRICSYAEVVRQAISPSFSLQIVRRRIYTELRTFDEASRLPLHGRIRSECERTKPTHSGRSSRRHVKGSFPCITVIVSGIQARVFWSLQSLDPLLIDQTFISAFSDRRTVPRGQPSFGLSHAHPTSRVHAKARTHVLASVRNQHPASKDRLVSSAKPNQSVSRTRAALIL